MKKILMTLPVLLVAMAAGAQSMTDALTFGNSNYYGTARSMALGNAMTAVGGDLGSIGLNPAGSAVNGYSQFSITPGITLSTSNSAFSQSNFLTYAGRAFRPDADNFSAGYADRYSRGVLPNIGFSLNFETGNRHGIKSMTFAMLSNNTDSYLERTLCNGVNDNTSITGYFANIATYNSDGYGHALDYDVFGKFEDPYYLYNREALAAYDSYMISPDGRGGYFGCAQDPSRGDGPDFYPNAGPVQQTVIVQKNGTKHDYIFNFAANYEDKLYFGFNLGLPMFNYSYVEYFNEMAEDPEQFPVFMENEKGEPETYYFQNAAYGYEYSADGEGIYAKLGVIYLPVDHLRLGISVQTPTSFTISEQWTASCETHITDMTKPHSASDVPVWENRYSFRSPWIFDFGAAYTIGERGLASVDYELVDYSSMRFKDMSEDYLSTDDGFYGVNRIMGLFCGVSRTFRMGLEYRITPKVSVRYGHNFRTNPERVYRDTDGKVVDAGCYEAGFDDYESGRVRLADSEYLSGRIRTNSFGFGYYSDGPFFADAALRFTRYPVSYYSPYGEYLQNGDGSILASPLVRTSRKVLDAVITFGWRF